MFKRIPMFDPTALGECGPRAFALAYGCEFKEAVDFLNICGLRDHLAAPLGVEKFKTANSKNGTSVQTLRYAVYALGAERVKIRRCRHLNVRAVLASGTLRNGRYILAVKEGGWVKNTVNHALAVVDGVALDAFDSMDSMIRTVWKFPS